MPERSPRWMRRAGPAAGSAAPLLPTTMLLSVVLLSAAWMLPADTLSFLASSAAGSSAGVEGVRAPRPVAEPPRPVAEPPRQDGEACTADPHRQFDFWRGSWEVLADGETAGHSEIRVVAGGCGLEESWRGSGGSRGTSLSFYDPGDGRWHQVWLGSAGLVLRLAGGPEGDDMILSGERTAEGGTLRDRITWRPLGDGRVRQLWEISRDGGETWSPVFDGRYRRR